MSLPSFTGLSPAATRGMIMHISSGTLPTANVYTGDGTQTCLSFTVGGMAVNGQMASTTLSISGASTMTGSLTLGGVVVHPALWKVVASDVTAPTTTNVAITDFTFTPVNGATYELEMMLICTSASTSTGVRIVNTGGTGALRLANPVSGYAINATGGTLMEANSLNAAAAFVNCHKGVFVASATTDLTWSLVSEVASSSVSILAGSYLRITRIA